MTWVRLEDDVPQHPKIVQVGLTAFGLWVAGLCYANHFLTDGVINVSALPAVFPSVQKSKLSLLVSKLVEARLWENFNGGYRIHDYHNYQPLADVVRAIRSVRAEVGRLGGKKSGEARRKQVAEHLVEANAKQNEANANPNPNPTPVVLQKQEVQRQETTGKTLSRSLRSLPESQEFETFYRAYPRKVGYAAARKAWEVAVTKASPEEIMAGLHRNLATLLGASEARFIPHPATWLNQERWRDEPGEVLPGMLSTNPSGLMRFAAKRKRP